MVNHLVFRLSYILGSWCWLHLIMVPLQALVLNLIVQGWLLVCCYYFLINHILFSISDLDLIIIALVISLAAFSTWFLWGPAAVSWGISTLFLIIGFDVSLLLQLLAFVITLRRFRRILVWAVLAKLLVLIRQITKDMLL